MIVRTHHNSQFTTFSNDVLQNKKLSWEARGMLCYLISLPENWETHATELSNRSPAGYTKNRRILAELERAGHIVRSQKRGENGRFLDWIYDIYDQPQRITERQVLPHSVKPNAGDPDSESQHVENKHKKKTHQKRNHHPGAAAPAGGGGSQRNALQSQNQPPAPSGAEIGWPDGIPVDLRPALLKKLAGLATADQQHVIDVFVTRLASPGEPLRDPLAYAAALCQRAASGRLEPPAGVVDERRAVRLAARVDEICAAARAGAQILVGGEAVELDDKYLYLPGGGCQPLGAALAAGTEIEIGSA